MYFQKLFQHLPNVQAPADLPHKILQRIYLEQQRKAKIRFALFSTTLLAAVGFSIPVLSNLSAEMVKSGAFEFISLLFAHFSDAMVAGEDFVFSLLESLPIFSISAFLATIFMVLLSLRFLLRDGQTIFTHTYFIKH